MRFKLLAALPLITSIIANAQSSSTRQANWQQKVDYAIEVTLDDANHIIRGFETITYVNNSPQSLDFIYMHIWPNAYKNDHTAFAKQMLENEETSFYFSKEQERGYIDSLDFFINGKGATWSFDPSHPDIVKINLEKPLASGEKCVITTPFLVKIPKVFSRLGHTEKSYNMTQWYPKPAVFDVNGWNPMPYLNQGEFYSEFGSFDVKISLPKNYIVAATGVLITPEEINYRKSKGKSVEEVENTFVKTRMKTVHFKQDSIHDFAWFASKKFGIMTDEIEIQGKRIQTLIYSHKESDLNSANMDAIKAALTYYSENSGLYPYSHASVVKSDLKAGGGMEYPTITVCDILNQEIIIHEVGHNWFYGILGNNERRYPWMDESINSYFEGEAVEMANKRSGVSKKQNFSNTLTDLSLELAAINSVRLNTAQAVGLSSEEYTSTNYGTMVYGKGALIFKHLRAYLGDELFKQCFNTYFETWKFKHPLPSDMQDVFEKVSGKDLSWFFQNLIENNVKLDPKIKHIGIKNGTVTVKTNTLAPIPLKIVFSKNDSQMLWVEKGQLDLLANSANYKKAKFLLDPNSVVFDANRKNNQYNGKSLFKKWPSPGLKWFTRLDNSVSKKMFVLPVIGHNIHNGFMLGAGFHNWSVPLRKFEYMIMPLYSVKTNTVNGYVNLNYRITPKAFFQNINLGVNNASFAYIPQSEINTYFRTKAYVNAQIKQKRLRSTKFNHIQLSYTNVASRWLEKASDLKDSAIIKNPSLDDNSDYGFIRLKFIHENKKVINPYYLSIFLERGSFKNKTAYFKPGIELGYQKTFNKKGKGFNIRAFAGTFISDDLNSNGLFMYRVGAKNGAFDYGMDQTLMGRNATSGLWSSHITNGEDNLKIKGNLGNFSKGFLAINLNSNLPGKIPLRPYADFCFMQKGHISDKDGNFPSMIYSGGISIDIIPKTFIIYFPLVQSQAITDVQEQYQNIKSFGQRICFTLVLNDFEPHRLMRKLKLI